MEEITCTNCNVDVDPEELKRNNLHCPTCGFDLSDAGDVEDLDEEDLEDEDEEEEEEEDDQDEK
jgi:PHP family Zn ribbon phosphoesterase